VAKEGGAGVRGNKEAEADAKEDLFHECGSECGRVEGDDFRDDGEPSEVAHGCKEVLGAVVCRDGAGLPDVDVDDGEWGRYRPGVDKFAVLAGGRVREDAVGTRALPGGDVEAEPVPVEPKADAMEGLEVAEVAGGGRRVEDVEDPASEGCGRDDEEKGTTGAAEWLAVDKAAVLDGDEAFPQWGLVGGWGVLEESAGEAVIGVGGQGSEDIM
jgi:hypothetical protein